MDPRPVTNSSSSSSSSEQNFFCGIVSCNSVPSKRQQSDRVLSSSMDNHSRPFKQFDIVSNCSDHHFAKHTQNVHGLPNAWMKKIMQEWKILDADLPDSIGVRVYEDRMDLLRAVIVGSAGTPYHDGLFFFDFQFTDKYPNEPPKAYFHAHGRIFNPNLYSNGKVCLSLLNTWSGRENCEKWDPQRSTMLQILVSIQGLVMNAQPYFNEPGFERTLYTPQGEKNSLEYNHAVFFASCDLMTYWLQKPPMHFEEFVAYHFYTHGLNMAKACGAQSKECLQIYKVCFKKRADKVLKEYKAREVAYRKRFALKDKAGDNSTGGNDGNNSGVPNKTNSKLKRFCHYLLKLGKKVLPMGN